MTAGHEIGSIEDFELHLDELSIPVAQLRRDPKGGTWLSPAWQNAVEASVSLQAVLRDYVAMELSLRDSGHVSADPIFAERLMRSLPKKDGDPALIRRRTRILAAGYGSAAAVAGWFFAAKLRWSTVEESTRQLHETVTHSQAGVLWALVAGILVACSLLLFTRPASVVSPR